MGASEREELSGISSSSDEAKTAGKNIKGMWAQASALLRHSEALPMMHRGTQRDASLVERILIFFLYFLTLEHETDRFPETSVRNCHYTLRNDPEELRPQILNRKTCMYFLFRILPNIIAWLATVNFRHYDVWPLNCGTSFREVLY